MKKFFKNTWPLWGIAIVAILIAVDVIYTINKSETILPEPGKGAFIQYQGEWIGGDIIGDNIHLTNGTIMDFNVWKERVGYSDP